MPPKARKKSKGKKDGDEIEDKYKKATHQIESLKDELVFRRELVRRAQSVTEVSRSKTVDLEMQLEERKVETKAVNTELVRQYRAVEKEMNVKVSELQVKYERTEGQLAKTEQALKEKCQELVAVTQDKNARIAELEHQIWYMESQHLKILESAFDTLAGRVRDAHERWVSEADTIQGDHKEKLLELGLKPLEF